MTVIATLITKHWTVHATDSLITERQHDKTYDIKERQKPKMVRVDAFDGAISYWGLAWDSLGQWNTYEWLIKQASSASRFTTASEFAQHLAQNLSYEIERLSTVEKSLRGLGLHFTAYEFVEGVYVPELFLIRNFLDDECKSVRTGGFEVRRCTCGPATEPLEGSVEIRKAIHTALQNNALFRFVNGDPGLYIPLANAVFEAFITMQQRGWVDDYASAEMHCCIARAPIEALNRLLGGIARPGVRIVGGKPHDLAVKPGRIYKSTSGD